MDGKPFNWKRGLIISIVVSVGLCLITFIYLHYVTRAHPITDPRWGERVDSFNNVIVYYNGSVGNTNGRNTAPDGYNLGLKYQCVEFVKRYYYQHLHHKMPNTYGNAKDFFNLQLADGEHNGSRDLNQYTNPSKSKPKVDDLIIFDGSAVNSYGHVAIVCEVNENAITIIQQNPGATAPSRVSIALKHNGTVWQIDHLRVLGWLRKE